MTPHRFPRQSIATSGVTEPPAPFFAAVSSHSSNRSLRFVAFSGSVGEAAFDFGVDCPASSPLRRSSFLTMRDMSATIGVNAEATTHSIAVRSTPCASISCASSVAASDAIRFLRGERCQFESDTKKEEY